MTSDYSNIDDERRTTGQEPNSELTLLNKNFESIFLKVAMLDGALLSLKKTTDYILNEIRDQPITETGFVVKNPKTGKRTQLILGKFIDLNNWLGSNIDTLRQYIWQDENDNRFGGAELGQNGISGDLNRILSLLCERGFSEITRNAASLEKTVPSGTIFSDNATDSRDYLELIKEEHNRLKVWISNTGMDEGALSILVNHDLYKHVGEILQSILVDLISLREGYLIEEPAQNTAVSMRNQWLDQAKGLLAILPDKSDKTENYLSLTSSPTTPRPGSLIIGNLNENVLRYSPSGSSTEGRDPVGNASPHFNTVPQPPSFQRRHSAPPEQYRGLNISPQPLGDHRPTQSHRSAELTGFGMNRPESRGSMASSSFSILVDESPLLEYLIESLKDSNKTLIALVRSLEMAKANLGEGSHSQVYQAIRDIRDGQQSQPSSPVEIFKLPPPHTQPFQLPSFTQHSQRSPEELVEVNSLPGTTTAVRRPPSSSSMALPVTVPAPAQTKTPAPHYEPSSPVVYPISPDFSPRMAQAQAQTQTQTQTQTRERARAQEPAQAQAPRYGEPGSPLVYPYHKSPWVAPAPAQAPARAQEPAQAQASGYYEPGSPIVYPTGSSLFPLRTHRGARERISPSQKRLQGEIAPLEKTSGKRSDGYLWARIKSAALTESRNLNYLLEQLEEIGFGLYCDKHSLLFSNSGLEKWVVLEVLRCMWHDDSQMTRDSFAEKAKGILSGRKDKWNFSESQAKNEPAPRPTTEPQENQHYLTSPPRRGDLTYPVPGHEPRRRLQHVPKQQLISSTPYYPQIQYVGPEIQYAEPLSPARALTFGMPAHGVEDRDEYHQASTRGHTKPYTSRNSGYHVPGMPNTTTNDTNNSTGYITPSPRSTHQIIDTTSTDLNSALSNAYQEFSAAYQRSHNRDRTAKDARVDGPEGAPLNSTLSKNKIKALRQEVSSVDPVEVLREALKEEARERRGRL
ncbi:hypothetical protein DFP73DRAFT_592571 [Morchella snyderi]|nr:hypothetical protein DFP73DRAFT_592571 [Morchella snyderi]